MVTFRNNNNRRNNFRRNDRNYKINNSDRSKFGTSFTNNEKSCSLSLCGIVDANKTPAIVACIPDL